MVNPGRAKFNWKAAAFTVATIIGLVGIFAAYHAPSLGQDSKVLRITTLANSSLLAIEKSIREDIKILYRNQEINNLSFVQVKLENTGNRAITEEDYEPRKPLQLIFPEKSNILDVVVLDRIPKDIEMDAEREQNNIVTLSSTLLNPGDRLIIRVLLTDMPIDGESNLVEKSGRLKSGDIQLLNAIEQREIRGGSGIWVEFFLVLVIILLCLFISHSVKSSA